MFCGTEDGWHGYVRNDDMAYVSSRGSVPVEYVEQLLKERELRAKMDMAEEIARMQSTQVQQPIGQAQYYNVQDGSVYIGQMMPGQPGQYLVTQGGTGDVQWGEAGEPQKSKKQKVQDLIAYYYNRSR